MPVEPLYRKVRASLIIFQPNCQWVTQLIFRIKLYLSWFKAYPAKEIRGIVVYEPKSDFEDLWTRTAGVCVTGTQ
ncbi:MAG: hypothetical protein AAFQ98_14280 [Bacteroidota bacterium]